MSLFHRVADPDRVTDLNIRRLADFSDVMNPVANIPVSCAVGQ